MTETYDISSSEDIKEPAVSKKKYCKCQSCKEMFAQTWDRKLGKYSDYKLCPDCRSRESSRKVETYKIDYEPFGYQLEMHNSSARFKVVSGGIRTGKDYSMVFELVKYCMECANEDRPDTMIPKVRAWIIAPTEPIAKEDFRQLRRIIPRELVASFSQSTNELLTVNGILIEVKSAYDPESLVGVGLDCLLITEAARIRSLEDVWSNLEGRLNSPGRGRNGKGGCGLINSSPLGKNYFYTMWTWGQKEHADYDPQWESWRWEHWDNPLIAKIADIKQSNGRTYRENLMRRMTRQRYQQDYLAYFLSDDDAVFKNWEDNCLVGIDSSFNEEERKAFINDWQCPKPYESYSIGYDPANINDEPILWIVERDEGKLKKAVNLKGIGWEAQFDRIAYYSQIYNNAMVYFGRTGHEIVGSQLEKRGVPNTGLNEQGDNKKNLVENLQMLIEQGRVKILDDKSEITKVIKFELSDYVREEIKSKTGKVTTVYHNGTHSGHDDHVSAAYFAYSNVEADKTVIGFSGFISAIGDDLK